jgi:hypothetical protein
VPCKNVTRSHSLMTRDLVVDGDGLSQGPAYETDIEISDLTKIPP